MIGAKMETVPQPTVLSEFLNMSSGEIISELRPVTVALHKIPASLFSNTLKIEVDGVAYQTNAENNSSPFFVINPYALKNGSHVLKVSASNHPALQTEITFKVQLSGNLSASIQNYLEAKNNSVITFGGIDSSIFDYDKEPLKPWFDLPNYKESLENYRQQGLSEATLSSLEDFCNLGYCVLPVTLEEELITQAAKDLESAESEGYQGISKGSSQRMELMHEKFESIRKIWCHPEVIKFLELIYKDEVSPCQTLCFMNGSQQALHQDGLYLTSFPSGYMCGVWIALEDVVEGAGQLSVVPGSHKMYRLYRNDIEEKTMTPARYEELVTSDLYAQIKEKGLEVKPYLPKKGQILIWHERLVHGGSPRTLLDQTRKSFVAHYYAKGCVAYYDSSRNIASKHQI